MAKTKEKDNTLIKRNKLIAFLKEKGIKRISPSAIKEINKVAEAYLANMAAIAKENMTINGRKTIIDKDIAKISENKADKENPEI